MVHFIPKLKQWLCLNANRGLNLSILPQVNYDIDFVISRGVIESSQVDTETNSSSTRLKYSKL